MYRKEKSIFAVALGVLLVSSGCSVGPGTSCLIDQWTQESTPVAGTGISSNSASAALAQTFFVASSSSTTGNYPLASVSLRLTKQGTFAQNVGNNFATVTIEEDASKGPSFGTANPQPDGTTIGSSNVDFTLITNGETYVKFPFSKPLTLTPNVSYWIILSAQYQTPSSSNDILWMYSNSSPAYSNGNAFNAVSAPLFTEIGTLTDFEFILSNC